MSVLPATCTELSFAITPHFNVVVYLCLHYPTRKDARPSHSEPDPFFSDVQDLARVAYFISRPRWLVTRVRWQSGEVHALP
jgi:hypothetical protein